MWTLDAFINVKHFSRTRFYICFVSCMFFLRVFICCWWTNTVDNKVVYSKGKYLGDTLVCDGKVHNACLTNSSSMRFSVFYTNPALLTSGGKISDTCVFIWFGQFKSYFKKVTQSCRSSWCQKQLLCWIHCSIWVFCTLFDVCTPKGLIHNLFKLFTTSSYFSC